MHDGRQAPCWASLPPELVRHVADCFLATNDIDYYIDFRAVCHDWRQATDDATKSWDVRFRPSRWIVFCVDGSSTTHLFVNTATGLFHHKDMPLLDKYHQAAATQGGFLVLVDQFVPYAVHVLNPFTGQLVRFMASSKSFCIMKDAATVFGSPPTLVLCAAIYGGLHRADLGGEHTYVCHKNSPRHCLVRQAICSGVHSLMGSPFLDDPLKIFSSNQAKMFYQDRSFLVESDGGALMITEHEGSMQVFKVEAGGVASEPMRSIGDNRAIFIGKYKCVSVDASKFPSINGNCVYLTKTADTYPYHQVIYKYDMKKKKSEMVIGEVGTIGSYDGGINITRLLSSYTATSPYIMPHM